MIAPLSKCSVLPETIVVTVGLFAGLTILPYIATYQADPAHELQLTHQEKVAFDKLKEQVYSNLTNKLLRTDLYLLRWIRANNLDVNLAVKEMHVFLDWRKQQKIDTTRPQDLPDIFEEHPYKSDAVDLQGRPVLVGSVGGHWNVRRTVLVQGKSQRLLLYLVVVLEELLGRVHDAGVTQFVMIFNFDGFNRFQHGCPMCIGTYVQLIRINNRFYPGFAHAFIVINAPQSFNVVLDLVRPVLNKETKESLHIFGPNKRKWKQYLDREISENQLTPEYGGTKIEDDYSQQ